MPLLDWGSAELNMEKYGQPSAPQVDLSKIAVPTAFVIAKDDIIADVTDVEWAVKQINPDYLKEVLEIQGGHGSFMAGHDMTYIQEIIKWIIKYSN